MQPEPGTTGRPDPQTRRWQQQDRNHLRHPFTDPRALGDQGTRVIVLGEGVHVWDSAGHRQLDAMSGLWCVHMGYGQRLLAEAAYRQLEQLPFYSSFFDATTPPAIELAALIARTAPPSFERVFFTGSGSESVDTAIRLVRRYWQLAGEPERHLIIARHNGYHGSTVAGSSLGGMEAMHRQGGAGLPGVIHVQQPHWWQYGRPYGVDRETFGLAVASLVEQAIVDAGPRQVAAFFAEPVQGAGGVIVPPATYWPEVQRICDKYGVLLVSDEVVCGFGRTGRWFGCETLGFRPDLITFAKGVTSGYVPLGGVLLGERVAERLVEEGGEFCHGFTYSGHPVACAVGLANVGLMRETRVVETVQQDIAPRFARMLRSLVGHPLVADADACGLMGALQLRLPHGPEQSTVESYRLARECHQRCQRAGLVVRAVGDRIVLAPPLIRTPQHLEEIGALLRSALDEALAAAGPDPTRVALLADVQPD